MTGRNVDAIRVMTSDDSRTKSDADAGPLNMGPSGFDATTAWAVGGTVTTVWGVVLGIVFAFHAPIQQWINQHSTWTVPLILLFLIVSFFTLGMSAGRLWRRSDRLMPLPPTYASEHLGQPLQSISSVTDLQSIWDREGKAATVWVISPELFYDLVNPECRRVVAANISRGTEYRYIVQNTSDVMERLEAYCTLFGLSESLINSHFLILPESDLTSFLTEIVIYDADDRARCAFGYPPASRTTNSDVIVFTDQVCQHYIECFNRVWLKHKRVAPMTGRRH